MSSYTENQFVGAIALKKLLKKLLTAAGTLAILAVALFAGLLKYTAYQNERVVKIALACDLISQQNLPDASPVIYRLLTGYRKNEIPNQHLYAIGSDSKVLLEARDLRLRDGENKLTDELWLWKFGGAYYAQYPLSKLEVEGKQYLMFLEKDYEEDVETINRQTLALTQAGEDYTVERQCRVVEPSEAHEAVKAKQATTPENKI